MNAPQPTFSVKLTTRYGVDVSNPDAADLASATAEVYHEAMSCMTESDYQEHPNVLLRCGTEDGSVYVLNVYRAGRVVLQQWVDSQYTDRLAADRVIENVPERRAIQLLTWLANGDLATIADEIARG